MTNTTNGWPGKPGVPLNPERDGWHWVKTEHGLAPWRWKDNPESIVWESGWEAGDSVISPAYFAALGPCTYLGPCLTPDEATALQARVAELEGALRELIDHTHDCEKELTEKLYRVDFCAESLPLTNARAALEGKKDA